MSALPPMGQDTSVYMYVPWQIQKNGLSFERLYGIVKHPILAIALSEQHAEVLPTRSILNNFKSPKRQVL